MDSMSNDTMVPILKDTVNAIICSDNCRAVTLSRMLCMVFVGFLFHENKILRSSDLQFGSIFATNEVISYNDNKGCDVFVAFSDATKAFDRIIFVSVLESY